MPTRDLRLSRVLGIGLPLAIAGLSAAATVALVGCTSDCYGSIGLFLVSPSVAPLQAAADADGIITDLGTTVVWWRSVVRIAVALGRDRRWPRAAFWATWLAGLVAPWR